MARKIRFGRKPCPRCRDMITTNALGRAAHLRHCTGTPRPDPLKLVRRVTVDEIFDNPTGWLTGKPKRGTA